MWSAIPAQERPVRNVPTAGFDCAKIMRKPAARVARFSARPVVSYIERSTRSLRTGNVENERELRACNKTSPTSIEERLQRSHKLGLNRAIQFDGRPLCPLRRFYPENAPKMPKLPY